MSDASDLSPAGSVEADPHGLDRDFIVRNGRTLFRFLRDVYWRVEVTPTFPLLPPIPLPSKWHTVYMKPIDFSKDYPPEAAKDRKLVRRLSEQVQEVLLRAMTEIPTSDLPKQEPTS